MTRPSDVQDFISDTSLLRSGSCHPVTLRYNSKGSPYWSRLNTDGTDITDAESEGMIYYLEPLFVAKGAESPFDQPIIATQPATLPAEVKLLDDKAFEELWRLSSSPSELKAFLKLRGLFVPEPPNELKRIANEIAIGRGHRPDSPVADTILYALQRGMELAEPPIPEDPSEDTQP